MENQIKYVDPEQEENNEDETTEPFSLGRFNYKLKNIVNRGSLGSLWVCSYRCLNRIKPDTPFGKVFLSSVRAFVTPA